MKEALRGGGEVEEEKEGWTKSGQKKLLMKKKKKTSSENIEAIDAIDAIVLKKIIDIPTMKTKQSNIISFRRPNLSLCKPPQIEPVQLPIT